MSRRTFSLAIAALLASLAAVPAHAAFTLSAASPVHTQNFDSMAAGGADNAWTNDATLPGWRLLKADGSAVATYGAGNGSSNAGAFYSFGSDSDRALGGVGSGGAYFGSPLSNTLAGYVAASFVNATGARLAGFDVGFSGEHWRNGGNTSAQTMVFSYGFGASLPMSPGPRRAPASTSPRRFSVQRRRP